MIRLCSALLILFVFVVAGASSSGRHLQPATPRPLRIIAFGAHPDDAELKASGVAALWAARGHKVKFVAMTNGDVGHFETAGGRWRVGAPRRSRNARAFWASRPRCSTSTTAS